MICVVFMVACVFGSCVATCCYDVFSCTVVVRYDVLCVVFHFCCVVCLCVRMLFDVFPTWFVIVR